MESDRRHSPSLLSGFWSCINTLKTTVPYWWLEEAELSPLKDILPFTFADLNVGFKYLGYYLKPGSSKSADWSWLVAKFEKKIGLWCNKWLSLGSRFILVKAVLESVGVLDVLGGDSKNHSKLNS